MSQFGCMCAILANLHVLRVKKSIVERYVSNFLFLNEKYAYFILNRIKYWALFIQNN